MSTKTQSAKTAKSDLAADSNWSGYMELANNTGATITYVSFEHTCTGSATVTNTLASMLDDADSAKVSFGTTSGNADNWFVSFLDASGNLCTGQLSMDFHSSSAGSTVEISLLPQTFTVTISGSTNTEGYNQL